MVALIATVTVTDNIHIAVAEDVAEEAVSLSSHPFDQVQDVLDFGSFRSVQNHN